MSRRSPFTLAALAVLALCFSAAATAQRFYDPPGRVARISDLRGDVVYSPGRDGDWYSAHRNRPLVSGDSIWADRGARAELQAGSTWIRLNGETSVEFLELNDRLLQLEVAEGTVHVRIRRLYPGQRVEVDTPNLALVFDRPGNFRIDVDRRGDSTTVEAREGRGTVYGVGGRFPLRGGDVVVFYGEDIRDYELYAYPSQDNFDRYVRLRDQRIDRSPSLRYVSDDLVGFAALDDYGRWSRHPNLGAVWFPTNTYSGWAPYQDGQWIWQEPWGWTWVDDEPWAFAPSHYGRWAWIQGRWGWVPGPRTSRSVYAPALVGFIEYANSIGWFALAPGDVYYPTYTVSPTYFNQVNASNSSLTSANLSRAYNSYGRAAAVPLAEGAYRNRAVPTAVTTVPKEVFTGSRPVREAALQRDARATRPMRELRRNLALRPGAASLRGAARAARVRPPREVEDAQVFVRNAPPAETAAPSAAGSQAPVPTVRERPRRVRVIAERSAETDARATGPRADAPRADGATGTTAPAAPGGALQPLDRAAPRARGGRRFGQRQSVDDAPTPAPTAPATPAVPAATPAAAPAAEPASPADAAAQAAQARAAERQAREQRREAMAAERKAAAEARQSDAAKRTADQQRAQADAEANAQQQREAAATEGKARAEAQQAQAAEREAAAAEGKARAEAQQAQAAEREAQREQREAQRAQRQAERQRREAEAAVSPAPAATPAPAPEATVPAEVAPTAPEPAPAARRRDCVPAARIEAMRQRGVPEERLAGLKACPAE